MKHLRTYESIGLTKDFGWKNIFEKDGDLYVRLYKLANEMQETVVGKPRYKVIMMEDYYVKLVRELLMDRLITFDCDECGKNKHTGICTKIEFSGGLENNKPDDDFELEYIHIKTDNFRDAHGIDDDLVIVHFWNVDKDTFQVANKYNL